MQTKTWAVVVMPRDRRTQIVEKLGRLDVEVCPARNCQEARQLLDNGPRVELVISDLSLSDGNWCDVFKHLVDNGIHASMVVIAPQADERLWSEVLWRGAYDLLVEPYEDKDIRQVVEGAVRANQGSRAAQTISASTAVLPTGTETAAVH